MSELQQVEQILLTIVANAKSSVVILNTRFMQLNQMIIATKRLMQGTSQGDYQDVVNQFLVAQKKLEYALECLVEVSSIGDNWISNHTNSNQSSSSQTNFNNPFLPDASNYTDSEPQILTTEEVNERWKNTLNSVDELIDVYRKEMVGHGVFDGAMLTNFLAKQRSQMLQYEAAELDYASGKRGPLTDDEGYPYVITGVNSPYSYSNLVDGFGDYCVQQVDSWVDKININSNNDPRRNVNCGQCAAAVFNRMNGDNSAVAGLGTYSVSEMNKLTGKTQTTMTPSQIENYLKAQGAGAHVVVGVDRATGAGHWFNAFYDGHQVYTIEGQSGCIRGWPPDYGNVVHWDISI